MLIFLILRRSLYIFIYEIFFFYVRILNTHLKFFDEISENLYVIKFVLLSPFAFFVKNINFSKWKNGSNIEITKREKERENIKFFNHHRFINKNKKIYIFRDAFRIMPPVYLFEN